MLHLKIHAPAFSFEQKKIMAQELTDAVLQAMALPESERERILLQFIPYQPSDVALGDRLVSETEEPPCWLEIVGSGFTLARKEKLLHHLIPLMLELMKLPADAAGRLSIRFREYRVEDFIIGEQWLAGQAVR
jgi:hypothetical protein